MRKRMFITVAIVLFSMAVSPCVAGPKAPAKVCLQPDDYFVEMALVTKSAGGNIGLENGPTKFLDVSGEVMFTTIGLSIPVKGSGHMDGEVFHFNLRGTSYQEVLNSMWTFDLEARWNVIHKTGSWHMVNVL